MFNNASTKLRLEKQKQVSQILGMTGHLQVLNTMSKIITSLQKKSSLFFFPSCLEEDIVKHFLSYDPFISWHSSEKLINISVV